MGSRYVSRRRFLAAATAVTGAAAVPAARASHDHDDGDDSDDHGDENGDTEKLRGRFSFHLHTGKCHDTYRDGHRRICEVHPGTRVSLRPRVTYHGEEPYGDWDEPGVHIQFRDRLPPWPVAVRLDDGSEWREPGLFTRYGEWFWDLRGRFDVLEPGRVLRPVIMFDVPEDAEEVVVSVAVSWPDGLLRDVVKLRVVERTDDEHDVHGFC